MHFSTNHPGKEPNKQLNTNHPGKTPNIQRNTNHPGKPPNKQPSTKQIKKNYICSNETIKLPIFKIKSNTPLVHPHL
jgi:hypothetical protein